MYTSGVLLPTAGQVFRSEGCTCELVGIITVSRGVGWVHALPSSLFFTGVCGGGESGVVRQVLQPVTGRGSPAGQACGGGTVRKVPSRGCFSGQVNKQEPEVQEKGHFRLGTI